MHKLDTDNEFMKSLRVSYENLRPLYLEFVYTNEYQSRRAFTENYQFIMINSPY